MFEKEADEWVIDSVCKDCSRYEKCKSKESCTCKECVKEKWQKGAEFGYNKANACHYPSMGDFPKTSGDMHKDWKPVLVYTKELGWTVGMRFKKNRKHEWYCSNYDGNTIFLDEEIFAWKELPELPKESE